MADGNVPEHCLIYSRIYLYGLMRSVYLPSSYGLLWLIKRAINVSQAVDIYTYSYGWFTFGLVCVTDIYDWMCCSASLWSWVFHCGEDATRTLGCLLVIVHRQMTIVSKSVQFWKQVNDTPTIFGGVYRRSHIRACYCRLAIEVNRLDSNWTGIVFTD